MALINSIMCLCLLLAVAGSHAARPFGSGRALRGESGYSSSWSSAYAKSSSGGSSYAKAWASRTKPPSTASSPTPEAATTSDAPAAASPATTSAPAQTSAPSQTSSGSSWSDSVLAKHNELRARHGAAPLSWSSSLASGAQSWADGCVMQHSGGSYGENLAMGYASPVDAVQAWYSESSQYSYTIGGFSESTGHFTQIVWKSSAQLGCGYASGCKLLVCRYSPAGNVQGQYQANVLPPRS